MQQIKIDEMKKEIEFVEKAARVFSDNKDISTFTDGEIAPGCLFALRWGILEDCIVVFKLDSEHLPVNYVQLITNRRA